MSTRIRIMQADAWHLLLTLAVLVFGMYLLLDFNYGQDDVGLSFKSTVSESANEVFCEVNGPFLCKELFIERTPFGVDWKKSYIVIDVLSDSLDDAAIRFITTDYDTCTDMYIDHDSLLKSSGKKLILRYNCDDIQPFDAKLFNHQIDISYKSSEDSMKSASIIIGSN